MKQTTSDHRKQTLYIAGFVGSAFLSIEAYLLVVNKTITGTSLLVALIGFAIIQFIVQSLLFLDLNDEPKPRWRLTIFIAMISAVLILVLGSIWIMYNLNYGHHVPSDMKIDKYLDSQDGF